MQARSKSSTRVQLARDLHDSLAQDLVAIGYKLELLTSKLPYRFRAEAREVRFLVSESTNRVRRELFALRSLERDSLTEFVELAKPLSVEVIGDLALLSAERKRIVEELIRNAAAHSKGRTIRVELNRNSIRVSDDGQGLFGISELVPEGKFRVEVTQNGTAVEVEFA